jgi:hypothetical protein
MLESCKSALPFWEERFILCCKKRFEIKNTLCAPVQQKDCRLWVLDASNLHQ